MIPMAAALATILCLFAVSAQAKLNPGQLLDTLKLSDNHKTDAYNGLDIKRDKTINMDDINLHFHHKDAVFAKAKFLEMVDINKDNIIEKDELNKFLEKKPITNALWECTYVLSQSLREYCFADQITTYIYLVLDNKAVVSFFKSIEDPNDQDDFICAKEVAALSKYNAKWTGEDQVNFFNEIVGDGTTINIKQFTEYVIQEDLQDDFRPCRTGLDGATATYNNTCLVIELMDYTRNHLTELDIAETFNKFNPNGDDKIDMGGLQASKLCKEEQAKRFINLMDENGDGTVCYGEFRTYLKSHTVKLYLEKSCTEPRVKQADELICYTSLIINLVNENHTPIWLMTPDLDMVFFFEELDVNNDGLINVSEDLKKGRNWDETLANKVVSELDGTDQDRNINLEEFFQYMGSPYMVYGLADCLIKPREERPTCYENELKDLISVMLDQDTVTAFYKWYDQKTDLRITDVDLQARGVTGEANENFLNELGMGNKEVTYFEFWWFVRQQELGHMFSKCDKKPENLHPILFTYLDEFVTEYDILQLFSKLDANGDGEIECAEFGADAAAIKPLIERMEVGVKDGKVNYVEFWLYLSTPIGSPRKRQLEKECTKPKHTQEEEMNCYLTAILKVT